MGKRGRNEAEKSKARKTEAGQSRAEIRHNKWILPAVFALIILLAAIGFLLKNIQDNTQDYGGQCRSDDDCVLQKTDCCGCSMGGQSSCMTEEEAASYQEELKECPKGMACIALYNCEFSSCRCRNGKCAGE